MINNLYSYKIISLYKCFLENFYNHSFIQVQVFTYFIYFFFHINLLLGRNAFLLLIKLYNRCRKMSN
nr:MAG TPA: hypothetical protein [Caudoviricetes sp.]